MREVQAGVCWHRETACLGSKPREDVDGSGGPSTRAALERALA